MAKPKEFDKEKLAELPNQYAIRPQTPREEKKFDTPDDIPAYRVKIDLNEDQMYRLSEQFKEEFDALKEERTTLGLATKWNDLDRQYDGVLKRNQKMVFNLHVHQSKIKTDSIVRALNEAFLDSDPIVDVSPRPEEWKREDDAALAICEKQQQFIDYEMDENIKPQRDLTLIGLSAVKKFVGIGKLEWCYEKEKRRREEVYEGRNEVITDPNSGQPIGVKNDALKEFVSQYPDAQERYPNLYKKISEGKTIRIVVEYLDTLCNCAKLRHVSTEDFYVKNSTNYNEGLAKAHLIVERQNKTWYELMKKVMNDEYYAEAVEDLKNTAVASTKTGAKQTYKTQDYSILEATTYFAMDENDEEETKIKAWFAETGVGEETEYTLLGCILYPYYGFDVDYIAFYVKLNEDGFYGDAKSVMSDLRDSNIAQDVLLNMSLHSIYIRNILTPILPEGSEMVNTFIENRWQDGKPIEVDQGTEDVNKAIGFVQYPQQNLQDFLLLGQQMKKIDDDVTGVSAGMSGRESSVDPHAPAAKTIALLQQSSINIKDYIRQFVPSFEIFASNILQLYYQMSHEGRPFQINTLSQKVTGQEAFKTLSRDEMIMKTNVQARAAAFAFDKVNEKMENLAFAQWFGTTPIAATQPEAFYKMVKLVAKSWSPMWANFAENDLMGKQEFDTKQMKVAMAAMQALLTNQVQKAQITGVPTPPPNPEEAGQEVTKAQAAANNPKLAEEMAKAAQEKK